MTIRLQGVRVEYPGPRRRPAKVVLEVSELEIADGAQLCITGRSGSGKSTLLNCLAGIVVPSAGTIRYDELDITELSEPARDQFRANNVGYVFQTFNLLRGLSCVENVGLAASLAGQPGKDAEARARSLLERVGLSDQLDERARTLSVGEQQRVAIARALINRPAVVLADEPTANLDDEASDAVLELLTEIAAEEESTLVLVTHESRVRERFDSVVSVAELGE